MITHFSKIMSWMNADSLHDLFYSTEIENEIVNISTGETIKLDSVEMFQLLEDYHKAIVSITERKFEEKKWQEVLSTPSPLRNADINSDKSI